MKGKRLPLFLTILALIFGGCQADTTNPPANTNNEEEPPFTLGEMKVAAYINTWGSWKAKNIEGLYLSELILAFALIDSSSYSSITMSAFSSLWNEVAELKEAWPDLKVILSVGGANEKGFPNMTADAGKRAAFIADVCAWMKDHNLDGVDIDWEFPNSSQRTSYITLLRETRTALDDLEGETGKRYSLSSAVSATYNASMSQAAEIVDNLKVMTYDYYGDWYPNLTGHNANLYNNQRRSSDQSTDKSIMAYLNAGIPGEKIMMGVAFYGKAWNGVSPGSFASTPGLFQSYTSYFSAPSWTSIKSYLANPEYTRYWDTAAKAPFLYNSSTKRWVSYSDGEQMQCLAGYAKEKKLGGVFAWEYSQDSGAELLKTLAENSR